MPFFIVIIKWYIWRKGCQCTIPSGCVKYYMIIYIILLCHTILHHKSRASGRSCSPGSNEHAVITLSGSVYCWGWQESSMLLRTLCHSQRRGGVGGTPISSQLTYSQLNPFGSLFILLHYSLNTLTEKSKFWWLQQSRPVHNSMEANVCSATSTQDSIFCVVYSNNSSLITNASFVEQEVQAHRADLAGGVGEYKTHQNYSGRRTDSLVPLGWK